MRTIVALLALSGCAVQQPIPDVFSADAHQPAYEPYRRNDCELWSYGYEPDEEVYVMRYPHLLDKDEQGYTPGDQAP